MAQPEDAAAGEDQNAIFSGVYFAIIPSSAFPEEEREAVTKQLEENGATNCPLSSSAELRHVTHLISPTAEFPAYHDAVDAFIHVVKPVWVDHSIAKKKAANPRQYSPDPAFFLTDVALSCADDIPEGDKDAIVAGVMAMGGQYSGMLSKLVTHVVALSMRNPQCKMVTEKGLKCKIVLPHWFDDCFKLGKKIDSTPYELPDPPILQQNLNTPIRHKTPKSIQGASQLSHEFKEPPSPSKSRKELGVFLNRTILVDHDIDISEHMMQSIKNVVNRGGGDVTDSLDEADMLICQYRESPNFATASRDGKDVGNLNWLYHLINTDTWTDPRKRLLHYPFPKDGVPDFKNFKISISNYTGEARIYLESLVHAAGGSFSKSMAQDNTHLITSHTMSEKCDAAREWNIHMVNHLWLEETYAKGQIQSITNPAYTYFPLRTNLVEIVGQTPIDRQAVETMYFSPKDEKSPRKLKQVEPNSSLAQTPSKAMSKKTNNTIGTRTPIAVGKENETPGSRGAKDRAISKLQYMAPDIMQYQKETKRVGGVVYGGRRVNDPDRINLARPNSAGQKRQRPEAEEEQDKPKTNGPSPQPSKTIKKQKRAVSKLDITVSDDDDHSSAQPVLRVLATSWERTKMQSAAEIDNDKTKLRRLGIQLVDAIPGDVKNLNFDVLAAPRAVKTVKFLTGLASAPKVVNTSWLEKMLESGKREDEDLMRLTKRTDGGLLSDSIRKAKDHKQKGGMLHRQIIFCTPSVKAGFESLRDIVQANGGVCALFKGRETTVSGLKRKENMLNGADSDEEDAAVETTQFLVSDPLDRKLWQKFKDMAVSENLTPKIVHSNWLTAMAMAQDPSIWEEEWDLDR